MDDKFPKDAKPGFSLSGSLKFAKSSPSSGEKDAPGSSTLVFIMPPAKIPVKEDKADEVDVKSATTKFKEGLRDAQVTPPPTLLFSKLNKTISGYFGPEIIVFI